MSDQGLRTAGGDINGCDRDALAGGGVSHATAFGSILFPSGREPTLRRRSQEPACLVDLNLDQVIAQMIMQSGLFVAADAFTSSLRTGLFTHYKRQEDRDMRSGKFDEEFVRMSVIADRLHRRGLGVVRRIVCRHQRARTVSEVAQQIVSALLENDVMVFFVSHMYEFARLFLNNSRAEFLRAERGEGRRQEFPSGSGEAVADKLWRRFVPEDFRGNLADAPPLEITLAAPAETLAERGLGSKGGTWLEAPPMRPHNSGVRRMKDPRNMTFFASQSWLIWALFSALFAAMTAICAKVGVAGIDSDLATFFRTIVIVFVLAALLVMAGKFQNVGAVSLKTWAFLVLYRLATGASWLCCCPTLKLGEASRVAPIDKLSVVLVAIIGVSFLGESLTVRGWTGITLIAAGAALVAIG